MDTEFSLGQPRLTHENGFAYIVPRKTNAIFTRMAISSFSHRLHPRSNEDFHITSCGSKWFATKVVAALKMAALLLDTACSKRESPSLSFDSNMPLICGGRDPIEPSGKRSDRQKGNAIMGAVRRSSRQQVDKWMATSDVSCTICKIYIGSTANHYLKAGP